MLAEVHAADELPDHHEVDALRRDVRPEGAGGGKVGEHPGGPDIRIQAHGGAELQKSPLGAVGGGLGVPLWPPHRPQQHAVGAQAGFQAGIRQGHAEGVNGAAAHGGLLIGEGMSEFLRHGVQHADGLAYDLGADSVAPDDGNGLVHLSAFPAFKEAISPPFSIMSLINGGKGSA